MKLSIEANLQNLKHGEESLGDMVRRLSLAVAREFRRQLLEAIDAHFLEVRDRGLKVAHIRPRWVSLPVGEIRVRRRQNYDRRGNIRYLLDECLGLRGKSPLTPALREAMAYLVTLLPFLKSSQVIQSMLPQSAVSHTSLHRLVKKIAEPALKEEEAKREALYRQGEIPASQNRVVPRLLVEADGVHIALQREATDKAEIKVGIAYEGWQEVSKGRYRLLEKSSYCDLTGSTRFWEGFSWKLATKYDLAQIRSVVIWGDGCAWVKSGVALLGGTFQLDRFHLLRALRQDLPPALVQPVYQAS